MNPARNEERSPTPEGDLPETHSRGSVYVFVEGEWDNTVRPIRSPKLKQIRPDQPPPANGPETK